MDVQAVRDGIAANLKALDGVHVHAFAPDNPSPPCAIVEPPSRIGYFATFVDSHELTITVLMLASRSSDRAGQERLNRWLAADGFDSVVAAIVADDTFGGAAMNVQSIAMVDYGEIVVGETSMYGARFELVVIA